RAPLPHPATPQLSRSSTPGPCSSRVRGRLLAAELSTPCPAFAARTRGRACGVIAPRGWNTRRPRGVVRGEPAGCVERAQRRAVHPATTLRVLTTRPARPRPIEQRSDRGAPLGAAEQAHEIGRAHV